MEQRCCWYDTRQVADTRTNRRKRTVSTLAHCQWTHDCCVSSGSGSCMHGAKCMRSDRHRSSRYVPSLLQAAESG